MISRSTRCTPHSFYAYHIIFEFSMKQMLKASCDGGRFLSYNVLIHSPFLMMEL